MLLGLSSVQGQGKTSLIQTFAQRDSFIKHKNLQSARTLMDKLNLTLPEINADIKLKTYFQDELLDQHFNSLSKIDHSEFSIIERTFVDMFCYALISVGPFNAVSTWLDNYYYKCCQAQKILSHTFYLQYGIIPVEDGCRSVNYHYAKTMDILMKHYLNEMQLPYSLIPFASNNVRCDQITQKVNML